jgi:Flp pilus assembly pilin Flp
MTTPHGPTVARGARDATGQALQMRHWRRDNRGRGATAAEYALMVALVIAVIVVLVATVGRQSST